jgi:hypothetical protein
MGESRFLRRRYRAIGSHVATILGLVGLLMLVPLLAILAWPDEGATARRSWSRRRPSRPPDSR